MRYRTLIPEVDLRLKMQSFSNSNWNNIDPRVNVTDYKVNFGFRIRIQRDCDKCGSRIYIFFWGGGGGE